MAWMETETLIRAGAFIVIFALLAVTEVLVPRRKLSISKIKRWRTNLTIVALNPLSVALVFPLLPIGLALPASEQNWGLFNQWTMPDWWDRLFGTYKDQPDKGHMDMVIGLSQFRDQRKLSLPRLLILPITGHPGIVPINRH